MHYPPPPSVAKLWRGTGGGRGEGRGAKDGGWGTPLPKPNFPPSLQPSAGAGTAAAGGGGGGHRGHLLALPHAVQLLMYALVQDMMDYITCLRFHTRSGLLRATCRGA